MQRLREADAQLGIPDVAVVLVDLSQDNVWVEIL